MHNRPFLIAIDFDGTVVDHRFPEVGPDVPGAVSWLRAFQAYEAHLILWTVRTQKHLQEAEDWYAERGIVLRGVNRYPGQEYWAGGPKVYANLYIDDSAAGVPLCSTPGFSRPHIDWEAVGRHTLARLISHGGPGKPIHGLGTHAGIMQASIDRLLAAPPWGEETPE